jgi:hypothetical protein
VLQCTLKEIQHKRLTRLKRKITEYTYRYIIDALFMRKEYGIGVTVHTLTINECLSTKIIENTN